MESLYSDLIKLLIEDYLGIKDSLVLFCVSRKFAAYGEFYRETLSDAKKGWVFCINNGKLASCKLIYRCQSIDIHEHQEWAFRWGCYYGHLKLVQWLYQLSIKINSVINLHAWNGEAFRWSCEHDQLEIVQWLYRINQETNSPIDIHKCRVGLDIQSCQYGPNVIKWFSESNIKY